METFTPFSSLAGGALIGVAASVLLLFHGRVAGISGMLGETLRGAGTRGEGVYRVAFLAGLMATGLALRLVYPAVFSHLSEASSLRASASPSGNGLGWIVVAGVVVGYGTRLGNGCTSGHGVCGISRLSKRSMVATMTFMAAGVVTVFVVRHVLKVTP